MSSNPGEPRGGDNPRPHFHPAGTANALRNSSASIRGGCNPKAMVALESHGLTLSFNLAGPGKARRGAPGTRFAEF